MNFRRVKKWLAAALGMVLMTAVLTGCSLGSLTGSKGDDNTLVVYSSHPSDIINPLKSEFEKSTGIKVAVVSAGSEDLLKRVEGEMDNPQGDVFWGGFLTTVSPKDKLFEPYISKNEVHVQEEFKNKEGSLTRFTDIPNVLMVNTNLAGNIQIEGYEDLLNPALKGKIAAADPAKSSSAFGHLVNMLYAMGNGDPEKGWDYVEKLCVNLDGKLLPRSGDVYQGVADGGYAVGITFEEGAAKYVAAGNRVKLVYMKEGVVSNPDGVYIIRKAKHMENAKKFIDFVTSKEVQLEIVQNLHRRSVRDDVIAPEGLQAKSTINIIEENEAVVDQNKQIWLERFREIFNNSRKK